MNVGPRGRTSNPPATLARHGYVEDEYVVRGEATIFGYDDGRTVERERGVPFVTRVLVRRPDDFSRASGDVVLEPLHPAGDMASAWGRTSRTILRDGWTWVGVTQDLAGLAATKAADPERYAELSIPKVGTGFDIVRQVAEWLRSADAPIDVEHLFMTGASYTGTFQRVFIGDGFHERARRPGGGPAVEGYLIQISSGAFLRGGYNPINPDDGVPPAGDRRRIIAGVDVPVIELLSEGEAETNRDSRRDDSDDGSDRYRLYEVPGGCHMSPAERDGAVPGDPNRHSVDEPSDFPFFALSGGALRNLRRWAVDGVAPPRAMPIELLADRADGPCGAMAEALPCRRDEHGNAIGGVRTPFVDVPVASYYPHSPGSAEPSAEGRGRRGVDAGDITGSMRRFSPERLRELYGTPEAYRERFAAGLRRLVDEGWIDEADARALQAKADIVAF